MKLFSCVHCEQKFTLQDVGEGLYFPSTGMCLEGYREMAKNKLLCFGRKSKFDPHSLACGEECPDRKICRGFVKHRKEFLTN